MKTEIDREGCIGCGMCAEICPEVFRIADDEKAEIYASESGHEEDVLAAAGACPVNVISAE